MQFDEKLAKLRDTVDEVLVRFMAKYAIDVLRVGLGIIFFWFGAMKLIPGMSPAEGLVKATVPFVHPYALLPGLALVEMGIGLGLITARHMRLTLLTLFLQMPGTALPMILLPDVVWTTFPVGLTLEGQYIVKNLVLVGAALAIGGTLRGGQLNSEPLEVNESKVLDAQLASQPSSPATLTLVSSDGDDDKLRQHPQKLLKLLEESAA